MPTGSRTPARQTQAGFSYLFVLMLIALIGMGLAAAGTWWQTDAQRAREAELLFIGDQYRQAIKHYYEFDPAQPRLPESVDDLLADNRPNPARHLRRAWRDPVSGVAFVLIQSADGKGIQGVHSPSTQTPLKTADFDAAYEDFSKASSYADWRFVFIPPAPAVQSPVATGNAPK